MDFWRFNTNDPALGQALSGSYDPLLVLLSIVLASIAGTTALILADRMKGSSTQPSNYWWLCGAVPMGVGVWAMHFTGMLAFRIDDAPPMSYSLGLTLVSLVPAVLASAAALYFIAQNRPGRRRLHICALLLAAGIGTMHYTGMEAMQMPGLRYDPVLFVLSLVIAHTLAHIALRVHFGISRMHTIPTSATRMIAGIVFGFAVAGMHYTAMAAASFHATPGIEPVQKSLSDAVLAGVISGSALLLLALSILAAWIDRRIDFQRRMELERTAHTDSLTGLPNRVPFQDRLERLLTEAKHNEQRLAVAFLDLNGFKTINDSLGHRIGDRVLQEIAVRLRDSLRVKDTVARFGGDEFVFIINDIMSPDDARRRADRLVQSLDMPLQLDDRKLHVTASVGLSVYPDDGESADALIQAADAAMYQAKHYNMRYYRFEKFPDDDVMERLRRGFDLPAAMRDGQISFRYQPWVDLASRRWLGMEALVRWHHPTEGEIGPGVLLSLAERSGLILRFEEWALRQACQQARNWLDMGFDCGRIALNISVQQFARWDFVEQLERILSETRVPGTLLELEITESSLMDADAALLERLNQVRQLGVTLAVDQFGVGYSSLYQLKSLPINKLKIDRAFTFGLGHNPKDAALIEAIVQMASAMGFEVTAEGIEHEDQRERLLALGCSLGQGHLFSYPLSIQSIEAGVIPQAEAVLH